MFNIGWAELLVLTVAGLFILGPERLLSAMAHGARLLRQIREYAASAKTQLRAEMGPEFDELRKPLQDLATLRKMDPKRAAAKHLFADLDRPAAHPRQDSTGISTDSDFPTSITGPISIDPSDSSRPLRVDPEAT